MERRNPSAAITTHRDTYHDRRAAPDRQTLLIGQSQPWIQYRRPPVPPSIEVASGLFEAQHYRCRTRVGRVGRSGIGCRIQPRCVHDLTNITESRPEIELPRAVGAIAWHGIHRLPREPRDRHRPQQLAFAISLRNLAAASHGNRRGGDQPADHPEHPRHTRAEAAMPYPNCPASLSVFHHVATVDAFGPSVNRSPAESGRRAE